MNSPRKIVFPFGRLLAAVAAGAFGLAACKPAGPPPDLVKTQREALEKSKQVEDQVRQAEQERRSAIEEQEK